MRAKNIDLSHRSLGKCLFFGLSVVLLASCRLVITTDGSGYIVSASGSNDCAQNSCVIPIEASFTESFTAVAAEGYRFVGWDGVCVKSVTNVCDLKLAPLTEEFRRFDGDVSLSAVFESSSIKRAWYRDKDGDNYGATNVSKMAFEQPAGFVINNLDCDDRRRGVHPGAKEKANGRDNNCNGRIDEGLTPTQFYIDRDGDGFGDAAESQLSIHRPAGYVKNRLDCNDSNVNDNPDAEEVVDNRDNDCDGEIDEGLNKYYPDVDGDGYGATVGFIESLEPVHGYVRDSSDCDDNNSDIFPGARETFDSADNDCDGAIDEGFVAEQYYRDADGDGYGDPSDTVMEVEIPAGYVANASDNCIHIHNPTQADGDQDGIGDACDPFTDTDDDDIQDSVDNCPRVYNPSQNDADHDGLGDSCDSHNGLDPDGDGVNLNSDNCPYAYNPSQSDGDGDGTGDACDSVDNSVVPGGGGGTNTGACSITAEEQSMLDTVNATRAHARVCGERGSFPAVSPLVWDCDLKAAALNHSMDMANNNFFSHTGSNGGSLSSRATAAGYNWSTVGENIAAGMSFSSVSAVVQGWIDSPGHCANLMHNSFTELGAAKYSNPSSTYNVYWTQVFGRPR